MNDKTQKPAPDCGDPRQTQTLHNAVNLTDEEIRIKVAESRGWNPSSLVKGKWCHDSNMVMAKNGAYSVWVGIDSLPNYPESLDACAEFEATLTDEEWLDYIGYLADDVLGYSCSMNPSWSLTRKLLEATARQRCLAYLKTKGIIP